MAIFRSKNFSRSKINNLEASNGDEFISCNFSQVIPHTSILSDLTGLVFTGCNLMNCDVPGDSIVNDCLTIQKELCANLHPELVEQELLEAENENCSHVIDTDEIWIDGELIDTIYHYKDIKVE